MLIHIAPEDLKTALSEIVRCSARYILGLEYFAENIQAIPYRGHSDRLWKANYAKIYQQYFPQLQLVKEKKLPYLTDEEEGNVDQMFLLGK